MVVTRFAREKMNRQAGIARWTILVLVAAGVVSLVYLQLFREKPVRVTVQAVERGDLEKVVANTRAGTVKAARRARLAPAIGGQISSLRVKEGDVVRKGQVLLELWNKDLVAQARLAEEKAVASRAQARQACIKAQELGRQERRMEALYKKGLASERDYDKARSGADSAMAACEAARGLARASEQAVAVARANLERTVLRAPFAGVVAEVNGEVGEYVTPSPTGIATLPAVDLVDRSLLYVSAPIDEVDAPAVKEGMKARITLDAFPGKSFPAKVKRVAPYVLEREKQARTVEVEALFQDPEDMQGLLPGYSADLEIILAVRKHVLRVPTGAVLPGNRVLVYDPGDHLLEERAFTPGISNWRFTEVISGLKQGELVVTSVDRKGVGPGVKALVEGQER